jgi:hypothetical protein
MRKLVYLLLVICLTISLVGCGGKIANTEEMLGMLCLLLCKP